MVSTKIRQIPLEQLVPHPDSPNRMSRTNFDKLVRNIERTGRYEPLVVRPHPRRRDRFQIINGRQRWDALRRLGRKTVDAVVWDVDDEQTDLLLATLNRLGGRDALESKVALLRRLSAAPGMHPLAALVPQTRGQIERLTSRKPPAPSEPPAPHAFAIPLVFFVDPVQAQAIEEALTRAAGLTGRQTRAARRGQALTQIARRFLEKESAAHAQDVAPAPAGPPCP